MQAVQTIGSVRMQRSRRSKHTIAKSAAKKLILPILLIVTGLLAVFLPTGADSGEDIMLSVNSSPQSAQSAAYLTYTTAVTARDVNDGGKTNTDFSAFYVDAAGVVPQHNSALLEHTSTSLDVGLNSPTHETTGTSFVVNIRDLITNQYQDIITVEESLGITGHEDVDTYVKEFLQGHYVFGESWYKGYDGFGGAIGPALVDRNYYSDDWWLKESGNNTKFWEVLGWQYNPAAKLDLMLVKNEDYDRYFAGDDVPVTYVAYTPVDYKAHSAPWGINQTYMYFGSGGQLTSWPSAGGTGGNSNTVGVARKPSMAESVQDLYGRLQATQMMQYWLPTLEYSKSQYKVNLQVNLGRVSSVLTGALFETGTNAEYQEFKSKYLSTHALVGVLVYPTV